MSNELLLAIDVGATLVRAGVYDLDGRCLAMRSRNVDVRHIAPGQVDVSAASYYDAAAMVSRRALRTIDGGASRVAAIGMACQMGGVVGIDEVGKPVTQFDPYFDERCQPLRERLLRDHEQTVRQITGALPYLGVKIQWWQEHQPDLAGQVHTWVTIGGYLAGRMARLRANEAFIDRTNIGLSGLADNDTGAWSGLLLDLCEVPGEVLPRIVSPTEVVGRLAPRAAEDFQMPPGVPIVAGLGDYPATFLGAGLTRPGLLCDLSGNACHFAASVDRFAADTRHRAMSTLSLGSVGLWCGMAYVEAGAATCRWLLQSVSKQLSEDELPVRFRDLEVEAGKLSPGTDGLLFLPHLSGRQCPWDPAMRGSWLGLRQRHTQAHLHRSILEAVALEYAYFLQVTREVFQRQEFDRILGIGGGARSQLWSQIKADVLGIPYVRATREDQALLGAAAVAAAGVNLADRPESCIDRWCIPGGQMTPDRENHLKYTELFRIYLKALQTLRPVFAELRQISLPAPQTAETSG